MDDASASNASKEARGKRRSEQGCRLLSGFIILFFLLLIVIPTMTGCWGGRELNQRAFVTGIAFDMYTGTKEKTGANNSGDNTEEEGAIEKSRDEAEASTGKEKYQISLQLPIPEKVGGENGSGGGEGKPFLILSATADTVLNGILQVQQEIDRELFFGHTRLIMIGEELAKKVGIERVVDFFNRRFQIQRMTRLAIVEGEAKEVLSMEPPIGQSPAAYILNLISPSSGSSLIYLSDLGKYNVYQADDGIDPVLPRVKKKKDGIETGGAGMIKDGKLVGWLTPFETRAFNILANEYRESNYVINSPLNPEDLIAVGVVKAGSLYRLENTKGQMGIRIDIKGSFETREFSGDYGPAGIKEEALETMVAAKVREEIEATLNKARSQQVDIFGIGRQLRARYPQVWKKLDWGREFPHFPIETKVEMEWSQTVRRLGQ